MKPANRILALFCVGALSLFMACSDDDPEPENIPELITKATLTFTPTAGSTGAPVIVTATDPDLQGPQDLQVSGPINLRQGTTYELSIELSNELYDEDEEGYDVTEEVAVEEGDEHQLFFRFGEGVFSNPTGTGNIKDNASSIVGPVKYNDEDDDGRPIGILTTWTTIASASTSGKTFQVILMHQPDEKSDTSTSLTGERELDITFPINVTQ